MNNIEPHDPAMDLDQVFTALADQTRRQLVRMLAEQDRSVSELAEPFDMSLAAVSKHIKVLEAAGIVARRVDGRVHTLALRPEALTGALDWISIYRNFWQRRLDSLDALFTTVEDRPPHED
ncbi:metalloregulator ArsR/SmtB family transcription factor [Undibacterium sp.]|jgi:DNA-binding transcriptional ArsR family regulator|uniref:ArsR/SmtB family transcription factor n=1 Tax=Undibacterium sp. TaxID=1914977 RepID=UPI002C74DC14|nr:metalloregulator ArsR/SmtB family transcription factor [Undibacterium sp.]HTD07137.1 metalloregulator ArsR/SmtB family transcription factor [Undibacterium sp.]